MDQTTVRKLVDKIDEALGPDAEVSEVEKIAFDLLDDARTSGGRESGAAHDSVNTGFSNTASAIELRAHISLRDCASRLPATLLTRTSDKISLLGGSIPSIVRRVFDEYGVRVPPVSLVVSGTHDLLLGYRKSEMLEVVSTIEQGALDAGFCSVELLDINLEKEISRTDLLDLLPDLLASTSLTRVRVRIGSSSRGVRAKELLETAKILFSPGVNSETIGPRVILYCYGRGSDKDQMSVSTFSDNVLLDLDLSVWPLLDTIGSSLSSASCYGDRMALLATAGRQMALVGNQILDTITQRMVNGNISASKRLLSLNLNAPGKGPAASGIWAGFPVSPVADNAAGMASASFLRQALLSDTDDRMNVCVVSDSLPLTYSLRNVRAFSSEMRPADLAGYLVGIFSHPIEDGRSRWISVVPSNPVWGDSVIQLPKVPGSMSIIGRADGWTDEHFSRGGSILPPTRTW